MLHRPSFTTSAYSLGYTTGFREDTSGYQDAGYPNANASVLFLDNNFHDPDPDQFLDRVDRYRPEIAVIGDAMTSDEAVELQALADYLEDVEPVIVPKCREALDEIDPDTVVDYANGYSEIKLDNFSKLCEWRGRRVHLLGGSPSSQYQVIQTLTQPTLNDAPPADIVGLDGNRRSRLHIGASIERSGAGRRPTTISIREMVERSVQEMKRFWQRVSVWPNTEPRQVYGPAVKQPDQHI